MAGTPFTVLFSHKTGELSGYEYEAATMLGPTLMRYEFKPYRDFGIGRFPSGYRFKVGINLYKDLNVLDARTPVLEEHPWFVPPPSDPRHAVTIRGLPPGSTEEVAPGVSGNIETPIRIVDIGCGTGFVVRWLAARGSLGDDVELIGVDFNVALINEAQ